MEGNKYQKGYEIKRANIEFLVLCFVGLILIFFGCFRGINVGTDNNSYCDFYNHYANYNGLFCDNYEIGFLLYIKLLISLGFNYLGFQIITTLFITVVFLVFIKRFCKNIYLGLFFFVTLGFYFSSLNLIRQYISIAIILIGLMLFFKKKDLFYYLFFVVLASLIHFSAVTMLLGILFYYIKNNWKLVVLVFSVLVILMLFAKNLILLLHQSFNISYIEKYIDKGFFSQVVDLKSMLMTFFDLVVVAGVFVYDKNDDKGIKNGAFFKFFIIGTLFRFLSLFGCFAYLIIRISQIFLWSSIVVFDQLVF